MPSLRFVYGRLRDLQITAYLRHYSGTASVYFDDPDNATYRSRVGLPYSVLPVAEQTIFGFGCKGTRGQWIHACNTSMQYAFLLHCCDVMALCTASQTSNKIASHTLSNRTFLLANCFPSSIHKAENTKVYTTLCVPKRLSPLMFDNNSGKYGPIFKILSPIDS